MNLQPGDILLTRNAGGEAENPSPGWFNHAAMYVGDGRIVEAQAHVENGKWSDNPDAPGEVIEADEAEFIERYPIIRVRRLLNGAKEAAEEADDMVGLSYKRISSFLRRQRPDSRGVNCVSVVRRAVTRATGSDPGWRRPDDINSSRLCATTEEKGFTVSGAGC